VTQLPTLQRVLASAVALAAALVLLSAVPAGAATQDLPMCLRNAHAYAGGTLVYTDERLPRTHVAAFRDEMWDRGRVTCVVRGVGWDVARAARHWALLPANQRPQTVVLALPGDEAQVAKWRSRPQPRRVTGTTDSGLGWTFRWPAGTSGRPAARLVLSHLGELTRYGGTFSGTYLSWLVRDNATQCARAAASPNGVLVLGDSITYRDFDGMRTHLADQGLVPCVWAQRSARVQDMLKEARQLGVPLPPRVVIALGNNDLFVPQKFRWWVNQVHDWVGPDRDLVWVTVWRTKQSSLLPNLQFNARVVNRIIRDAQAERGPRSAVAEMYPELLANPQWLYDGIHLTSTGHRVRYDLIASALRDLTPW